MQQKGLSALQFPYFIAVIAAWHFISIAGVSATIGYIERLALVGARLSRSQPVQ